MAGFLDQIGGLLDQYATGNRAQTREEARNHYDQIAGAVPADVLGSVIGPAVSSLGGDQVHERVQNSATEMNPSQRGQFVQTLLSGLGGAGGGIGSILSQLGIRPTVQTNPQQATPDEVAKLAQHAQQNRPEVFNRAMEFYAQHPTLVKVLGTLAIAKIAQQLSTRRA